MLKEDVGVRVAERLVSRLRTGGSAVRSYSIPSAKGSHDGDIRAYPIRFLGNVNSEGFQALCHFGDWRQWRWKNHEHGQTGKPFEEPRLNTTLSGRRYLSCGPRLRQLDIWGSRIGAEVIKHRQGSDPSAVVFDGIAAGKARNVDVVLIDTAGRLHTKVNLMDELKKMKRVLAREMPGAPHEVLLTLDGTIGQNALSQAKQFHEALGVTGLVLTKPGWDF